MSKAQSQPTALGHLINNRMGLKHLAQPQESKSPAPIAIGAEPEANRFVYPILTSKGKENDFAVTIRNYNRFVKDYNHKVALENAKVRKFNKEVIRYRKQATVTTEQRVKEAIWKEEHSHLDPEAYNTAVAKYNKENGPQLRQKNVKQPVKKDSEKFFIAILHQFNMQLFKRQSLRKQLGIAHLAEIPKAEIYPNKIVELERDGYKVLPVSVETVRHHRERLEEAGVLSHYEFRGDHRAVKVRINPQILSITDNGIQKKTVSENQQLTESQTKKVPHNNVSSRGHVVNKNKIRDKGVSASAQTTIIPAEGYSGVSATAETTQFAAQGSTRSPIKQDAKNFDTGKKSGAATVKKNSPGAAPEKKFLHPPAENSTAVVEFSRKSGGDSTAVVENEKPVDKNPQSAVLTNSLIDPAYFVKALSSGKYIKYRHLEPKVFQQEAYYGAMHPDDFVELAIQDLFKFSSSIFEKLDEVHPGSWMNAYKLWIADKFKSFNGHRLNKPNIFERWGKCLEVLKEVKAYAKNHPEWYPHFPSLYFDPARTQSEHNSFEFAYRNFRLEDERVDTYKRRKINANKSLRHKTDVKKAQEKIRLWLRGKLDLQDVYDFAQHNLDRKVNEKINDLIQREWDQQFEN
ncbi:hypothetical protein [Leeuwenhoekiella marinoflava]|uniref:Uncharacterized protein n=2 Tax=Leeuwenhoekiella marinoflava TaxID=988 RepID=A0A4Q0PPD8_9FLAO|nr:hypothetical protein [Leeuwenhoekiella marinoflava]RXG32022.1 hypothetical protein DSL99_1327 [Leeuwenhoekiella marinoflava]SHE95304.1 hypothetical protein SAMN02745246_01383 [Leeuwenhoekiella marinoflava DSM 3653]